MSSNCLLTRNGFCQLDIPLEYFFFSFLFHSISEAFSCAVQVKQNQKALPPALNSLSGNRLFCFTVKTSQRFPGGERKKEIVSLIVSGENIIWERKPCYWMHYHINDRSSGGKAMLIKAVHEACSECAAKLPSAENLLFAGWGHPFWRFPNEALMSGGW